METIFDWVSLIIFAGLIVLFLQRSIGDRSDKDVSLVYYLGAGIGCAVSNYLGNQGHYIAGIALLAATIGFIIFYLKPFNSTAER